MALVKTLDKYIGTLLCAILWPFKPLARGTGKNILVVKMWGMGDAVILLPIMKALRAKNPEAKVIALATRETAEVFSGYADWIIVFRDKIGISLPLNALRTVADLGKANVGTVFDFEQFTRISSIFAFLSGAAERIGYCGAGKDLLYTKCVKFDPGKHAIGAFADIPSEGGMEINASEVSELVPLKISREDEEAAKTFIEKNGVGKNAIGIHPGSGNTAVFRRWEKEKFAELADKLAETGYAIVLTGTPSEKELLEWIATNAKCKPVIAMDLTLKQFCALSRHFKLFVGNDTGTMHIAAAMGAPTLGIFGPNSPQRYAPLGKKNAWVYKKLDCSPCIHVHKGVVPEKCPLNIDARCIRSITVQEVLEKAKGMLGI